MPKKHKTDQHQRSVKKKPKPKPAETRSAKQPQIAGVISDLQNQPDLAEAQQQHRVQQLGSVLGNQELQRVLEDSPNLQREGELSGTSPITGTQQGTVEQILNPNQIAPGVSELFIPVGFDTDMEARLDAYVLPAAVRARAQLDPSSPSLDLDHIQQNISAEITDRSPE